MKKIVLIIIFTVALIKVNAQDSYSEKFIEANTLMEENQQNIALPIWLKIQEKQPNNNNVNYKIGVCYLKSANDKNKALPFLLTASKSVSKNYNPFSSSEKKAPIEAKFYLAKAYHLNSKIDSAIIFYTNFKSSISKKHFLFNKVDHHLKQCENAKIAMKSPVNIKVNNLGKKINSEFDDYSPVISIDESTLYFTSKRIRKDSSNYYTKDPNNGKYFDDIYVSHNYDGVWTKPELVAISSEDHEATLNISVDGQSLYVYKDEDIYTATTDENENWSKLTKLDDNINSESMESHAHISTDGNTFYFVSERKGGLGGKDIFKSKKLPNGQWGKAQSIGNGINTSYNEDGIFLHPDGKTLYFSSEGHTSIGGYDIFSSTMDEEGNWSKPENLGYPINSTDDDVFFVTSVDGKRGYYSSFQESGFGGQDVYQISLEDVDAKPVTLLTGLMKVKGKSGCPDNAIVTVIDNETGELVGEYRPRRRDCKFSVILTPGNDYHIIYAADNFKQEEDLYIPAVSAYQEINRGIDLNDVIFGIDAEEMVSSGRTRLDQLKAALSGIEDNKAEDSDWKVQNNSELGKLKASITSLERLENGDWNKGHEDQLDNIQERLDKLNSESIGLDNIYSDDFNEKSIASYQEYFGYNNKELKATDANYKNIINKALEQFKTTGTVKISLESSASRVPTKTHKTNNKLAIKRANDAKEKVIASLIAKGVTKEKIIILNINSKVRGPKYAGDYTNKSVYEKFQYVTIRIH
ncbi:MAG: hypothetical protein QMB65_04950 [Vicingaceae bacterium]